MVVNLGKAISLIRKYHNIKIKDLAEKTTISAGYLSELENGKKVPTLDTLNTIALAFDIKTSQILKFSEIITDDPMENLRKFSSIS